MTPLAQALNAALLHFVWQGIVIGFLLWIALFLLRRGSANARYVACCVALLLLALAPVVTAWTASPTRSVAPPTWKVFPGFAEAQSSGTPVIVTTQVFSGFHTLDSWILPVWGLGVSLFALRLMWCWGHTSALRRTGTAADDAFLAMVSRAAEQIGVTRRVRVLMSSLAEVPSVIGWARPVLLLPVAVAAGLTPEQLEALIAHEVAHIRRHDYLVNLGQTVVETVLFYHPIVWWVSSRTRYERELCCDDLAVAALGDATRYARALARLEEVRDFRPSLAMGAARGPLFHRIERLLGGDGLRPGPSRVACAIGLLIGVACLALNMGWAQGRQGIRWNEGAPTEVFFAAVPPLPALPPFPPFSAELPAIPEVPAPPPVPPYVTVSPMFFSAIQRATQADVSWVLFRGNDLKVNATPAEEAEARAARQSAGNGDALWFRLGSKAYLTQDKTILDRIADLREPVEAILQSQESVVQQKLRAAEVIKMFQGQQSDLQEDLHKRLESIKAQIPTANTLESLNSVQREVEKLRRSLMELEGRLQQQEVELLHAKLAAQFDGELKLRRMNEEGQRFSTRIPDVLRDAVSSGKAQPVK